MSHKLKVQDLNVCVGCGECNIACPIFQVSRLESSGPRGKLFFLAQQNNENPLPLNQEVLTQCSEVFFNCTLCGACEEVCESNLSILEHLEAERGTLIRQNLRPELKQLQKKIIQSKNLYGLDNEERTQFSNLSELVECIPSLHERIYPNRKKAQIIFFLGCLTYFRSEFIKSLEAAIKLLEYLEEDYLILGGEENCCGQPIVAMGLGSTIETELKAHNLTKFKEIEAKTIITNCPGCLTTLKRFYGEKETLRFLHLTEFLDERISPLRATTHKKVVYHDPCELVRLNDVKRPPRSLLTKMGIEVVEIESSCCGGGGLLRASNPELSKSIVSQKIQDQGLDQYPLVTSCPSCLEQFKANEIEANDLLDVLLQALEGDSNAT